MSGVRATSRRCPSGRPRALRSTHARLMTELGSDLAGGCGKSNHARLRFGSARPKGRRSLRLHYGESFQCALNGGHGAGSKTGRAEGG